MSFDYLRELADRPLPQTVTDEDEIDKLRILKAAGCVEARISSNEPAVVMAITDKGRISLSAVEFS